MQIETKTKKELCNLCKIHANTLRKYLKNAGIETGRRKILLPGEVQKFLIFFNS